MDKKNIAQTDAVEMETKSLSTVSSEGELSCVLIYPDQRHVSNYTFAPIFDLIKETLIEKGFRLRLLSNETRDATTYLNEFVKIANECVYGVVILDGLRPNVLLELGILMGLNKPFTLLKSEDAEVSVKTLYDNWNDTRLTRKQFDNLRNPRIKIGGANHLSDFSTHLTIFDPSENKGAANHVSTKLAGSIERMKDSIEEEYTRITAIQLPGMKPDDLQEYQTILFDVLRYYFRREQFNVKDIRSSYETLRCLEEKTRIKFPTSTRSIIGSLYTSLETEAEWKNVKEVREYFGEALRVYGEALEYETDDLQKADMQMKIGNTHWKLSGYYEKAENCKKAIKAYEKALKVRTPQRFPMQYASTQNNLGVAYQTLADIEAKPENCKKAIKAFEKALEVRTPQRFPMQYASTQNNLGNAYQTLADVEAKPENCKKAIKAYQKALKVYTLQRFPMDYAMTQNNLGNAYRTLAEVEAKAQNCKKAMKAFEKALEVRTPQRFPMQYASTQNNLGSAYGTLAEVEAKSENSKKAIKAFEKALKVYTPQRFPMDYAMTQNNLGNAYHTLAEVEAKAQNCRKAIKACEEALKVYTLQRFPMDYAMTQNNLGSAYGTLAEVEAKPQNCKKAIKAFEKALKVTTLERFPMQYAATQSNLGNAYSTLAEVEAKAENCKKGIKAYEEALKVFTKEEFPEVYPLVERNLRATRAFCYGRISSIK